MSAIHDARRFAFVPALEAACDAIRAEMRALGADAFRPSPDSLTAVDGVYDENGWHWIDLYGLGDGERNLARCPATARALGAVPGLVNAGFSLLRPGTHLYPHCGELPGVLRCHLPLVVPDGDVALRFGDELHRWREGECVVFDDTFEHTAWNRSGGDRIVLLLTFQKPGGTAP